MKKVINFLSTKKMSFNETTIMKLKHEIMDESRDMSRYDPKIDPDREKIVINKWNLRSFLRGDTKSIIRMNLMSKRPDYCGRTVAGPICDEKLYSSTEVSKFLERNNGKRTPSPLTRRDGIDVPPNSPNLVVEKIKDSIKLDFLSDSLRSVTFENTSGYISAATLNLELDTDIKKSNVAVEYSGSMHLGDQIVDFEEYMERTK